MPKARHGGPRGATPAPRSGGCTVRRRAERSYSTFKVRRGGHEEIPSSKVRSSGCALLEQP